MRRQIKGLSRFLGIDDGPHAKHKRGNVLVFGTVMRGSEMVDGFMTTEVEVDGTDSTARLAEMVNSSRFSTGLKAILLDGIALGGFNIVDIKGLHIQTGVPVIAVMRSMPDLKAISRALDKMGNPERFSLIEKAGPVEKIGKIYIQRAGVDKEETADILRITTQNSLIPEPIRLSHMAAAGVVSGCSKGDA